MIKTVCILGGTGFVGGALVPHLNNLNYRVKLLTRSRERHRRFLVMPDVQLVPYQSADESALAAQFAGADAVINLIGILNGSDEQFERAHAVLPAAIARACVDAGVGRYLHMSALHAAADAPSRYLQTKQRGEQAAFAAGERGLAVTSFRPSVIFGPGDGFFHRFAALLKVSPALPLACPNARFAPVYIGDVVAAFSAALADPAAAAGKVYQLCGPRVYSLKELVEYTAELIGKRRLVIGLSDKNSLRQAKLFDVLFRRLPGEPPLSLDNYRSLQIDSVCDAGAPGLAELGITPTSVESVMPRLFGRHGARDRYQRMRQFSRR